MSTFLETKQARIDAIKSELAVVTERINQAIKCGDIKVDEKGGMSTRAYYCPGLFIAKGELENELFWLGA